MGKKICLLGTAPQSFRLAPFDDPTWEIWACSPGTTGAPRIDTFFELHRWEPGQPWCSPGYVQFLKDFGGDVVMSDPQTEIPNCLRLPWENLVERYGPYFFTSSLAWMLAMAIDLRPTQIKLCGVDMASATEYYDQRLGCQYFAMIAAQRGIDISVPPESDLLRPAPLYGVCETSHAWIKQTARARDLAARSRDAQQAITEKTAEMHYLKGALDEQDWVLHSWQGGVDTQGQQFTRPPVPQEFILAAPRQSRSEALAQIQPEEPPSPET